MNEYQQKQKQKYCINVTRIRPCRSVVFIVYFIYVLQITHVINTPFRVVIKNIQFKLNLHSYNNRSTQDSQYIYM